MDHLVLNKKYTRIIQNKTKSEKPFRLIVFPSVEKQFSRGKTVRPKWFFRFRLILNYSGVLLI